MGTQRLEWTASVCGWAHWKTHDAPNGRGALAGQVLHEMGTSPMQVCRYKIIRFYSLLAILSFASQVDVYAKDGKKFAKDFSAAFQKLTELGTSGLTPTEWA